MVKYSRRRAFAIEEIISYKIGFCTSFLKFLTLIFFGARVRDEKEGFAVLDKAPSGWV